MGVPDEHFTLSNGVLIPKIGFGTWQVPDGDPSYNAVAAALDTGYVHIDTAHAYHNEASVGRAIAHSGIDRHDIFLTTKLPADVKSYNDTHVSFTDSLHALGTDYIDLYLIHWPWPLQDPGADYRAGNAEAWRAMEELLHDGRVRAIGVSNFTADDIDALLSAASTPPATNQIKFHVGHTQPELAGYCRAHDILVEGYSPLATGAILHDPGLGPIADTYGKSVAQLCIRYVLQKGVVALPKTTTPSRMRENTDVDFKISDADMTALDAIIDTAANDDPPLPS